MKLIQQIENQRKLKGMNKQTLCLFAKVNKNSYSNYLTGKTSPTLDILEKLIKALDCKLVVLDNNI